MNGLRLHHAGAGPHRAPAALKRRFWTAPHFITETPVDALLAPLCLLLGFIAGTFFGYCRGHFRSSSCYIEPLISSPLLLSSR